MILPWSNYTGHDPVLVGKYKTDNTIYTFDIETTSYINLDGDILPATKYLDLSKPEQELCECGACMFVWQFGINDQVYYGRTWLEFKLFLDKIEKYSPTDKVIFVHNLSFEFQFLRSQFKFKNMMSRKSRHVIRVEMVDYNITFQCSYMMSNVRLEKLSEVFNLPVQKMVGDFDYSLLRNHKTPLTEKELKYCENDCLVLYYYIKMELETYDRVTKIPPTSTGKVRKELQKLVMNDYKYRAKVGECINTKPSVYNMLVKAFAGGYTHANYIYTGEIFKNVDSYDETSAYPYVLVTHKLPMSEFKPCNLTRADQMCKSLAYLMRVKLTNIKCKYYNNFISMSKCENVINGRYDNGRIMSAKEVIICLTDVDFRFIMDTYEVESYEILEAYSAVYKYLPIQFINFILDKYELKTRLKNVKGKEIEYQKEKNKFNSLYGMCVTNMIRDEVNYEDTAGWSESEITNSQIFDKLLDEKKKSFLSFAWGVWVTAYARDNLLRRTIALDEYTIYMDTDSLKLREGYNKQIFEDYNKSVIEKIKKAASDLNIPFERYAPYDIKGSQHILGLFEFEGTYEEFITQGAKKYADKKDGKIEITVSGVPKGGAKCLKSLKDFKDDLIFDFKYTNKLIVAYNDNQKPIQLVDYNGIMESISDTTGVCLLPTTYNLKKSLEYALLVNDNSSKRALYKL